MGAEDQPFYYGAKARSLASQAIAQAKNEGLKGAEATKFIEDLIKNPTDKMMKYAVSDAEIAVFQNKTTLGEIAQAVQKAPGGEIVVPTGQNQINIEEDISKLVEDLLPDTPKEKIIFLESSETTRRAPAKVG